MSKAYPKPGSIISGIGVGSPSLTAFLVLFASAYLACFSSHLRSLVLFLVLNPPRPDYTPFFREYAYHRSTLLHIKDCNRSRGPLSTFVRLTCHPFSLLVSHSAGHEIIGGPHTLEYLGWAGIIWIAFLVRSPSPIRAYDIVSASGLGMTRLFVVTTWRRKSHSFGTQSTA
jgi:hypothetical protein